MGNYVPMSGTFYLVVFLLIDHKYVNRIPWESFHDNADVPKIVWLFSLLNAILGQLTNVVWVCCSYIAMSWNVKRYYVT